MFGPFLLREILTERYDAGDCQREQALNERPRVA
jgi:hypothetical protein